MFANEAVKPSQKKLLESIIVAEHMCAVYVRRR